MAFFVFTCSFFFKLLLFFFGYKQHAKKVVSDSLGLVDFTIGLVNSGLNLPDEQINFGGNSHTEEL